MAEAVPSGTTPHGDRTLMMRMMAGLVALIAAFFGASQAIACTLCHSRTAEDVRAAISGADSSGNVGALFSPVRCSCLRCFSCARSRREARPAGAVQSARTAEAEICAPGGRQQSAGCPVDGRDRDGFLDGPDGRTADRAGRVRPRVAGPFDCGAGAGPPRAYHRPSTLLLTRMFTATRRFCALPSGVALLASGSALAMPVGVSMRYGFHPQACCR